MPSTSGSLIKLKSLPAIAKSSNAKREFADKVDLRQSPLPKPKRCQRNSGNAPDFDLRTDLYRISGVDFTRIDGLGVLTVQTILSEVGLDPKRFPTVKHFTSWLGLCPGSRITGGKVKSSQTRYCS